jgi:hypothetical protein
MGNDEAALQILRSAEDPQLAIPDGAADSIRAAIRRRRHRRTISAAALLLLVAASTGYAATALRHHGSTPVTTSPDAIVIDALSGETFTPEPSGQATDGVVAPEDAYQEFAGRGATWPADATVRLGRLTIPIGPGAPGEDSVDNQLVWAISFKNCGPVIGPPHRGTDPSDQPPLNCTQWIFFDAASGELVEMTWSP